MRERRKAHGSVGKIRALAARIEPATATWLGRVASYEDGLHYPGGPDAQPYRLTQAVGVVRGEQAILDAEADAERERAARRSRARGRM